MKLKTLFITSLTSLLLAILVTVFVFSIKATQEFIENQVYSNSQDTAYSLGMSLAALSESNGTTDMELMINAIFDSGYYEYIKLYDTHKQLLIEASLPVVVKNVPAWFINFIPLHLKEAHGSVNQGWVQFGSLAIKGHAGYAYYELWKIFKYFIVIFGAIMMLSILILFVIINTLLHSLKGIKEQADAINEHRFILQKRIPFVSEFSTLVQAMNHMVTKVEGIFQSEVRNFQNYQSLLYKDEETTLPNKKYLILKLKEMLQHDEHKGINAHLAIISFERLSEIKKEMDYRVYKKALLAITSSITEALNAQTLLARIGEGELAILFDASDGRGPMDSLKDLHTALMAIKEDLNTPEKSLCFNVGVASFVQSDQLSQILSRADYALNQSKTEGCNSICTYEERDQEHPLVDLGKNAWRQKFEKIFSEGRITLALQPVIDQKSDAPFHREVLLRIREEDASYQTAGFYLPMAYSLDLIPKFDQKIVDMVFDTLPQRSCVTAINLSREFITQSHYFQGLRHKLSLLENRYDAMLHFECNENDIFQALDTYCEFSEMIHGHHQFFGIDRFSGLENIEYLERVRPHYIKIPVSFIEESHTHNPAGLNALKTLTQAMGITIIITAVQTEDQYRQLCDMGFLYAQGIYVSEPEIDTQ